MFPENRRGFSAQSVHCFCSNEGIAKIFGNQLDDLRRPLVKDVNDISIQNN